MIKRTLTGLKRKGTLNKWRDEKGELYVRIYYGECRLYWRDNSSGYTDSILAAGIYKLKNAIAATRHCGPEKKIEYHFFPEACAKRAGGAE